MKSEESSSQQADLLIDRMRVVRSVGYSHAHALQGEAKRLVDWREYVLSKPLVSVAAVSVLGFAIVRGVLRSVSVTTRENPLDTSQFNSNGLAKSTLMNGVLTLGTSIASSAIKRYVANLVQNGITDRGESDRHH